MIEETLYSKLNTVSALTAIVGSSIFVGIVAQGTSIPFVCINPIKTEKAQANNITGKNGLYMSTFQFDIVANSAKQAAQIQEAIIDGIDGFRGTVSGFNVQKILFADARSNYDPDLEGHRRLLEFDIDYCL